MCDTIAPLHFKLPRGPFIPSLIKGPYRDEITQLAKSINDGRNAYHDPGSNSGSRKATRLKIGETVIKAYWGASHGAKFTVILTNGKGDGVAVFDGKYIDILIDLPAAVLTSIKGRKVSDLIDLQSYAACGFNTEHLLDATIKQWRRPNPNTNKIELEVTRTGPSWESIAIRQKADGTAKLKGINMPYKPKSKR